MEARKKKNILSFICSGFVLGGVHVRVFIRHIVLLFVLHCVKVSFHVLLCASIMLSRTVGEKLVKTLNNGCHPAERLSRISSVRFAFSVICK